MPSPKIIGPSLLISFTSFLLLGCEHAKEKESLLGSQIDFKDAQSVTKVLDSITSKESSFVEKGVTVVDPICADVPKSREQLTGLKTVVKLYEGSKSAGITVPGFGGLQLGKDEASLNVYYIETKPVKCDTVTKIFGIGYSVHFLIKKVKRNLSVSNLPVLAASVQLENNRTDVYYSIQSYGVAGNPLAVYFKPVVNEAFDVKGFGVMQSSIDGIHKSITNDTIAAKLRFTPEELTRINVNDLN